MPHRRRRPFPARGRVVKAPARAGCGRAGWPRCSGWPRAWFGSHSSARKYSARAAIGLAHDLEHAAEREVRLSAMRVDLDRHLEPFAGGLCVAFVRLDLAQPDDGIHIVGVDLERTTEALLRFGQTAVEEINRTEALLGNRGGRRAGDLLLKRGFGRGDVSMIDRRLSVLDDLLRLRGLFRSRRRSVRPSAQPGPSAPGLSRAATRAKPPFGEKSAPHGQLVPSLGLRRSYQPPPTRHAAVLYVKLQTWSMEGLVRGARCTTGIIYQRLKELRSVLLIPDAKPIPRDKPAMWWIRGAIEPART